MFSGPPQKEDYETHFVQIFKKGKSIFIRSRKKDNLLEIEKHC